MVYFSGTFCGLGTLGLWLVPVILGHNLIALFMALVLYTIGLGGFVPLSAIIPNLVPENKGAAISALNLGSGLSNFLGPLIVSIFISPFGSAGALIALAVVYFLASPLSYFLKTPDELNQAKRA
ncbi:MFS transporter [Paucilactobacillus hokkaidonensis]|uniref:MFS transporter n=1 Tax=Paucilactobacillus hokkaidonensis TaxID=1193095 RepID=UPI000AB9EFAA|nr:MFS transporter [Paucilactobacillus hokkaidonensis]